MSPATSSCELKKIELKLDSEILAFKNYRMEREQMIMEALKESSQAIKESRLAIVENSQTNRELLEYIKTHLK